ncbi:MAG: nitrous oxide reductase family maturation protein NosD [Cyclobacteriaceae bacterium]|nr:nitrous oxide reductase family maturation protein NosD [Cyclobacteriaceae bacterium]
MLKHFLLLLLLISFQTVFSKVIPVGKGEQIQSIKVGIALAQPGDTLLIRSGIYREGNIRVEKSIFIQGENFPVLDGQSKFEILTIRAANVVVQGLTFLNTGMGSMDDIAAIKIIDSKNIHVIGNVLENAFFGIHFSNSTNCFVEGNTLHSESTEEQEIGNGIHLWKCQNMTIHDNKIQGHRDGIYFEFVTNSVITNNYSESNKRYGLHFMFSHNDEYRNNTFIDNGAGVAVMYTKGVKMLNNTFEHNWGSASYGLLLKEISDSDIVGNVFVKNSIGIFMEGSNRNKLQSNSFLQNGYALKLQASCDDNILERNNFQQNTFDLVTNGSLVLNKIDGNYWDRYEGYDLNRDLVGDIPYRPISMYGMIVERMPTTILLWRSFLVFLMDRAEKAIPVLTPENLKDNLPAMKPYDFN